MFKLIRQSVLSTLCLAVLLCAAYPMLVTGAADAFFPKEAAGSLILRDGAIVGSALIGQPFSSAKYFHPRPSAAGYNAGSSSGSNYGPTSKALAERVRASEQELRAERPEGVLPVDMLTASGSGLDPHISPDAALMQVRARGRSPRSASGSGGKARARPCGRPGMGRVGRTEGQCAAPQSGS